MKRILASLLFFTIIVTGLQLLSPTPAEAARVAKVKGKKAIIVLEGMNLKRGDLLYATSNGKKKAILQVLKTKGRKALVRIRKGKAQRGYRVVPRSNLARKNRQRQRPQEESHEDSSPSDDSEYTNSDSKADSNFAIGALVGYGIDSMDANLSYSSNDKEAVSMTGSGVSVKILGDLKFSNYFGFRITTGLEQFNVYGEGEEDVCDDQTTTECTTEISFITLDGLLKVGLLNAPFGIWGGAGVGLLAPSSINTTALDESSITTTFAGYVALGFDIYAGDSLYFPFQFDYALFNNSADVATTIIAIRGGLAFQF